MNLSAIILTNKLPDEITSSIRSVSFADETILIRDHPGFHPLAGDFAAQRNYGLAKAKGDWVLFVDDDEVITKELSHEIQQAIRSDKFSGFYLKRVDRYHGQILHHGETGNMKIIRLGRKSAGVFTRPVHEFWQIKGAVGQLKNPLIHERGDLVTPFIDRMTFYGPIDARELDKEHKPFTYWRLFANPKGKFIANYFLKLGFLDGCAGLFQAYLMSIQSLTVRVFQWQKT